MAKSIYSRFWVLDAKVPPTSKVIVYENGQAVVVKAHTLILHQFKGTIFRVKVGKCFCLGVK